MATKNEIISICPKCKTPLKFSSDRAVSSKAKCPKCKYEGSRSDFEESIPTEGPNPLMTRKLYKPGRLEMVASDAQWLRTEKITNLKRGINTLGRRSPTSTSNTQLPTTDDYMSRNHATIDVVMKADGIFDHRLSDNGSNNGTFHNSDRLEKNEVINLTPGDLIRLGHTTFKFIPG